MTRSRQLEGSSWWIEVYAQPTWRRLVAAIYHWYDMRVFKVPGFKWLESQLERRQQDPDTYVPLSARQDIRCYDLHEAGRRRVVRIQVTKEQYDAIKAARLGEDPGDTY